MGSIFGLEVFDDKQSLVFTSEDKLAKIEKIIEMDYPPKSIAVPGVHPSTHYGEVISMFATSVMQGWFDDMETPGTVQVHPNEIIVESGLLNSKVAKVKIMIIRFA